jgi:hypothetical protein
MADEKISALPSAGALSGTEPLPIVQGGVTKKTTVQDVADLKATPDLQQVTTAGATTSVGINIDNGAGENINIKHDQIIINNALGNATITSPTLTTATEFRIPNKLTNPQTFAMLSDITAGGDVFLANDQTFTGENTFDIPSGNDTPVTITKGGNGAAIKVTKSSGSGDAIEVAEGSVSIADETASTIAHFDGSKRIKSLATSTYPSLTELALVKGVTGSDIQTQINGKMTNPMTTGGDIIYGGSSGAPTRLANGTAGQILQSNGTTLAPSWVAAPSAGTDTQIIMCTSSLQAVVADATNYHIGIQTHAMTTGSGQRKFKFAEAKTLTKASFSLFQTVNASAGTVTIYLRNITTATDDTIGTFTSDFGAATSLAQLFTGLSIAVNTTDDYEIKILTPTWTTNPTNWIPSLLLYLQ